MKTNTDIKRTYDTLCRRIYGLCNEETGFKLQNEFFAKWFIEAFPEKLEQYITEGWFDDTYCEEWISRFMNGTPTIHMDRQRLKAYMQVAIEWNESSLTIGYGTKILLEWNDKIGKFRKYILNESLQQPHEDERETYYVVTQYVEDLEKVSKSAKSSKEVSQ